MSSVIELRQWHRTKNQSHIRSLMHSAGVPRRYLTVTPELPLVQKWIGDQLHPWLEAPVPPAIFFHGPPGTGKTLSAVAYIRELLLAGIHACWWNDTELAQFLRHHQSGDSRDQADALIQHLSTIPHLFLDDIGTARITEWWGETRYTVINTRYNNNRATTITMNDTESLDDRTARRIVETSLEIKMIP